MSVMADTSSNMLVPVKQVSIAADGHARCVASRLSQSWMTSVINKRWSLLIALGNGGRAMAAVYATVVYTKVDGQCDKLVTVIGSYQFVKNRYRPIGNTWQA